MDSKDADLVQRFHDPLSSDIDFQIHELGDVRLGGQIHSRCVHPYKFQSVVESNEKNRTSQPKKRKQKTNLLS